jgi:hypothetical protein
MFFGETNPTFLRGYAMSVNLRGNGLWGESTVILCWVCFARIGFVLGFFDMPERGAEVR